MRAENKSNPLMIQIFLLSDSISPSYFNNASNASNTFPTGSANSLKHMFTAPYAPLIKVVYHVHHCILPLY